MLVSLSTGVPYDISIYTLCIDKYEDSIIKGSFMNNHYKEEIFFNSTVQMLFAMENIMNITGCPKKYEKDRTFFGEYEPNSVNNYEEKSKLVKINDFSTYDKKGILATFYIKIRFRQNSSWQGNIKWREKGKEEDFRSVLELLKIIDSAFNN